MKILMSVLLFLTTGLFGFLLLLAVNVQQPSTSAPRHLLQPASLLDEAGAVASLRAFVQQPTICKVGSNLNVAATRPFEAVQEHIKSRYGAIFERPDVSVDEINVHSFLVTWHGARPELDPVLFNGHYDVVPAGNASAWAHSPFSGDLENGVVWGRGTLDMKGTLVAILEAMLQLHLSGYKPQRSLLLSITHDEEVGGFFGSKGCAEHLARQGIRLAVVFDEGSSLLVDGLGSLMQGPVALVSTAEKGRMAFKIVVETGGGHASMPPTDGSHTGNVLARAIAAVNGRQPPLRMQSPMTDLMRHAAPHAPFLLRGLMANVDVWPVGALLARAWALMGPTANALVRSTAVPTMIEMGVAHNVVPARAEAVVDMRVLQGQGGQVAVNYMNARMAEASVKGARVWAELLSGDASIPDAQPSLVTQAGGDWWERLVQAIQEGLVPHDSNGRVLHKPVVVLPGLLMGRTDSVHYANLSDNGVFRFMPIAMNRTAGDTGLVHGVNERVHVNYFLAAIQYYVKALQLMTGR